MRRTLFIFLIIIALLALGGGAYFIWSTLGTNLPAAEPAPQPTSAPSPVTATTTPGKLIRLGQDSVLAAYFVASGTSPTAVTTEGRVLRISGTQETPLSESTVQDLQHAAFSKNGALILVKFGTNKQPLWTVYDTRITTWTPLSAIALEAAAWSPQGNDLVYLEEVNDKHNLGIMKFSSQSASGTSPQLTMNRQTLTSVSLIDQNLSWPSANQILIADKPSRAVPGNVTAYNVSGKTFSLIGYNETGTNFIWGPDGTRGLKFYHDKGNHLVVVDAAGKHLQELAFVTMPEKCTFAEKFLYCAVPQNAWDATAVLPDDYLKQNLFSQDDFYRINLETGETSLFYRSDTLLDATALKARDGGLYFLSRADGHLYELSF